jgi:hypothetical protein
MLTGAFFHGTEYRLLLELPYMKNPDPVRIRVVSPAAIQQFLSYSP